MSPHALALLVAVALLDIPPTVIEEPGGPIPAQEALPGFAPTIVKIAKPGLEYVWTTVSGFVSGLWHDATNVFAGAATLGYDAVSNIVDNAINASQTAWSSMINHVEAFAATGLVDLFDLANTIEGYFLELTNSLQDQISNLGVIVAGIDGYVAGQIWDAIQGIDQTIQNGLDWVVAGIEGWAIDNIYNPLLGDIEGVIGSIDGIAQGVYDRSIVGLEGIVGELGNLLNAETLARAGQIAGVLGALAAIETWLAECGDPMCASFGPKTDLGKLLKALNLAATAALLAELAALDGAGIERLLAGLVSLSNGVVNDIDALFTGGETVGQLLTGIGG